jgi:hypothetical protein
MNTGVVPRPALLLVDDRERVREDLVAIFHAEFPDVEILETDKGDAVVKLLTDSSSQGLDVVALVIEIRTLVGGRGLLRPNFTHRNQLFDSRTWALSNAPVIFFHSPHPDDPVVLKLRVEAANRMTSTIDVPRQVFIHSTAPGWDEALLHELRKVAHPRRVTAKLAKIAWLLTQQSLQGETVAFERKSDPISSSLLFHGQMEPTHLIAELVRDMQRHSDYFRSDLRGEVARFVEALGWPAVPELGGQWP